MTILIDFDSLISSSQGPGDELALVDPHSLAAVGPPIADAWRFFSGAVALRRAGHPSEANDWFNASISAKPPDPHRVLRAEQVAEGGLSLFAEKRWAEAAKILQGAGAQWVDLCQLAVDAKPGNAKTTALSSEIAEMLHALGAGVPASRAKGKEAPKLVRAWLEDRAVLRRAEVLAAYARILAGAEQHADARNVCDEAVSWIAQHLSQPASMKAVPNRSMSSATRHALYRMMLARGDVELAAGEYLASADSFADAVKLYDGHVDDRADMSRMIQAHVNQANSLLRLGRFDDALDIYELAQMGFRSIGDEASAARVEHAKLFARTKKVEADEP